MSKIQNISLVYKVQNSELSENFTFDLWEGLKKLKLLQH
jgi:hypothetical protein